VPVRRVHLVVEESMNRGMQKVVFEPRDIHAAPTTVEDHVRGLIEQILFTWPGERVDRPDFG
jgi:phage baseplate assembly protein W